MTDYTADEERMFSAWSDYRSEYGAGTPGLRKPYADFLNGWVAARDRVTGGDFPNLDYEAGFKAYHGDLDIGGVMR